MVFAFVDDTGDPGTGGSGSPWLGYVSFVVPSSGLGDAYVFREKAAARMPETAGLPENWHAEKNIDDFYGTLRLMANELDGWCWHAVLSNTAMSTSETSRYIHRPAEHRYWVLLWLLERISWLAESRNEQAEVFVERSGDALDETELRRRYERGLPNGRGASYHFLDPRRIHISEPVHQPLLNLADTIAYAVGKAVNPHKQRNETFPEYLEMVWPNVWAGPISGRCNLLDYGFRMLPWNSNNEHRQSLPFVEKWLGALDLVR